MKAKLAGESVADIRPGSLEEKLNFLLPQTQCGKCGYSGCRPYAIALANGASINKCPPGGLPTIQKLANLLNTKVIPLDPQCGEYAGPTIIKIREDECIGCTKCIQVCPVDAITGAAKLMHSVINFECTGCGLCIEPCPVDCIDIIPVQRENSKYKLHWMRRFQQRLTRLERLNKEKPGARRRTISSAHLPLQADSLPGDFDRDTAKQEIAAAVSRVKARRSSAANFTAINKTAGSYNTKQ
jgi:electron transport complex protein RnfB